MVLVDFSEYRCYSACPVWWRNFVDAVLSNWTHGSTDDRNRELEDCIAKFHGRIMDDESGPEEIDYIEFETEEDLTAFKLIWTIHGK